MGVDGYVCTVNPNNEISAVICSRGPTKMIDHTGGFFFCFSVGHSTGLFDDSIIVLGVDDANRRVRGG